MAVTRRFYKLPDDDHYDGSTPLIDERLEKLAQEVAFGTKYGDAYNRSHPKPMKECSAKSQTLKIIKQHWQVKSRITFLQKKNAKILEKKFDVSRERVLERLAERGFAEDIQDRDIVPMMNLISDICGYKAPEKKEVKGEFSELVSEVAGFSDPPIPSLRKVVNQ